MHACSLTRFTQDRARIAGVKRLSGIPFAERSGSTLRFDLTLPDGEGPHPLLVFIHGGGWVSGDRSMFAEEAEWVAERGWAAACISYRLAPLHNYPAPIEDVQTFLVYAVDQAKTLGIDPSMLVLMGNSAGGYLALMASIRRQGYGHLSGELVPMIAGAISVCGITRLDDPSHTNLPIAMSFVEQYMGVSFAGNEELWRAASPFHHAPGSTVPTLLVHGTADDVVPYSQSQAMHDAVRRGGGDCTLVPVEGEGHSFTWDGWLQVREAYVGFLTRLSAEG